MLEAEKQPLNTTDAGRNYSQAGAVSRSSPETCGLSEEASTGGSTSVPAADNSADENSFFTLEVRSMSEGLEKAAKILGIPEREIESKIIDKLLCEIDGAPIEVMRVEFRRKKLSGVSQIWISPDKCTAAIKVLYPKKTDGSPTTFPYLLAMIRKAKITEGLNLEIVKSAAKKAQEKGEVLEDIEFARGIPAVSEEPQILQSIFPNRNDINYKLTFGRSLEELFALDSVEAIKQNAFPIIAAKKGETLAVTTKGDPGKVGRNIFGELIIQGKKNMLFEVRDYVEAEQSGNNIFYRADLTGYLELCGKGLHINIPIHISADQVAAYYIKLPLLAPPKDKPTVAEINEQLRIYGIVEGIDTAAIATVPGLFGGDHQRFEAVRVAASIAAIDGRDARVELLFGERPQAGKLLEGGAMDYREIEKIKTVKKNQLIAIKYFPTKGQSGKTVTGKIIEAAEGNDVNFNPLENVRIEQGRDKISYYSDIDGRVVIIKDRGIRVNPVCQVGGDVDFSTGNIDFNGDVDVVGSVVSGFRILAKGDITIGGMVNHKVRLMADGDIKVKNGIVGLVGIRDTTIQAKGNVTASYIQGSLVEAGGDVFVDNYIFNSIVKTDGRVMFSAEPSTGEMKKSIVGGEIFALGGVEAYTIGSEMSAKTQLTVGITLDFNEKLGKYHAALGYCDDEYAKVLKYLRIGIADPQSIKRRLDSLPPNEKKLFIDALKRLKEIITLRKKLQEKQQELIEQTNNLAHEAEIVVKKILFPRVNIQIGKVKIRTENALSKLKLKISQDGSEINYISL